MIDSDLVRATYGTDNKLELILRAGGVLRYHTEPLLRKQNLAEHSWRMAAILNYLWPYEPHLILAALHHDVSEIFTGDIPSPIKRLFGVRNEIHNTEVQFEEFLGITDCLKLEKADNLKLKFSDYAELCLTCYEQNNNDARRIFHTGLGYVREIIKITEDPQDFIKMYSFMYERFGKLWNKRPLKNNFYVYALFRWDGSPFYIGIGKGNRWLDHEKIALSNGNSGNIHKDRLIRKIILERGEIPKIKIMENVFRIEAERIEIFLIAAIGRYPDGPLLNITSGGRGYSSPTSQSSEKMSKSQKKRLEDPIKRANWYKSQGDWTGKKHSLETIEKMRLSAEERWSDINARLAHSKIMKASEAFQNHLSTIHENNKGKPLSEERKIKIAEGMKRSREERASKTEQEHPFGFDASEDILP